MPRRTSEIVIHHNAACATSRKILGMIGQAGPSASHRGAELLDLLQRMAITPCCVDAARLRGAESGRPEQIG